MISMKNNGGRNPPTKLPVPQTRAAGAEVTNPLAIPADVDLSIPDFLDAKKTAPASATAPAKGPLSQIAQAITEGRQPPSKGTEMRIQTNSKTTAKAPPAKAKTIAKPTAKGERRPATTKAKDSPARKPVGGVGATAEAALLAGKTNEQALAAVMKAHPDCSSNIGCIRWYRNKLVKAGKLKRAKKLA